MFTILVVDDDLAVRKTLATELAAAGYAVQVAESAKAAETLLKKNKPNLVVTDWNMRGGGGAELIPWIWKHAGEGVPVILISGNSREDLGDLAHIDAFFPKPLDMCDFLGGIERVLARRRLASAAG